MANQFQGRPGGHCETWIVKESTYQNGRAGLHEIENPGHDRPADPAPHHRSEVEEDALPRLVVRSRAGPGIRNIECRGPGDGGGDEPDAGQAHGSQWPGEALGEAEVQEGVLARNGRGARGLRVQGSDGPGLGEPYFSLMVDGPLGVLRGSVMQLDLAAQVHEPQHLVITEAGLRVCIAGLVPRGPGAAFNAFRATAGDGPDLHLPVPHGPFHHGTAPNIHHVLIRIHGSGNDGLSQARAGVNHCLVPVSCHRVGGEHDSGGGGIHHLLHHNSQGDRRVINPVGGPVRHGTVCPQRRPAAAHSFQDRVSAHHVQEGVLLTGETRESQVLRGC